MPRIETEGSIWFIVEAASIYYRTPKGEGPREPGDWEEPEPGNPLHDLEAHPYEAWCVINQWEDTYDTRFPSWARVRARRYAPIHFPILCIHVGGGLVVSAPGVVD